MLASTVLLLLGGEPSPPHIVAAVGGRLAAIADAGSSRVIAADGGLRRAVALGLRVDDLVGDLDSVTPTEVAAAEGRGTTVHRHPADKDATDAELGIALARTRLGPGGRLVVIGGRGGRLDHLLADVSLLTSEATVGMEIIGLFDEAIVQVVRPGRAIEVRASVGEQVSVLPFHGAATGVDLDGFRWPLSGATLEAGTTLAISNELVEEPATVAVETGVVAVIAQGLRSEVARDRPTS